MLILVSAALVARGHHMILIDGVLQHGFEKSDFYDRSDCSRGPWWFDVTDTTEASAALHKQWVLLGRPAAIHIRYVGNVSSIGRYGHLGHYRREVIPVQILDVSLSSGCVQMAAKTH